MQKEHAISIKIGFFKTQCVERHLRYFRVFGQKVIRQEAMTAPINMINTESKIQYVFLLFGFLTVPNIYL